MSNSNSDHQVNRFVSDKVLAIIISMFINTMLFSYWFGTSKAEMIASTKANTELAERCLKRNEKLWALVDRLHGR